MGFMLSSLPDIKETDEVTFAKFVPVMKVVEMLDDSDQFAWNHAEVIKQVLCSFIAWIYSKFIFNGRLLDE